MSPNRFSFDFILKDKLETKWTFWICKSLPLSEILDNYLLIFFWFQLFLLTFWNSNYICIWTFCPTFTKLWSSLKYLFFSVFQIQYFLCSVFKFSDSSVISSLAFGVTQKQSNVVFPIYWNFYFRYYIF